MSPRPAADVPDGALLGEADAAALREAVADAVLTAPHRLRQDLGQDPAASLTLVLASRIAAEETSRLLHESVASARAAGHSWDAIGRLIGVSRQAAQQRFGPGPAPTGTAAPGAPERRVLTPLTAFSEMAVLEREGRRGWQLVDHGPLFHVVEASDSPWEHRRGVWSPATARTLAADGWTLVKGTTFPWGYYKRRLAGAPDPGA